MKVVWIILSVICLGIAGLGGISDLLSGQFSEDTVLVVLFMACLAGVFGYLAWVWRNKSPIKRTAEQVSAVANQIKHNQEEEKKLTKELKARALKYRIIGIIIIAFSILICIAGNWRMIPIGIGTVVLIIGIAVFMMASPESYNATTDMGAMIPMSRPRTIEEFYEAFKNVRTPLGSGWLGKFSTSPYVSLIFGPDEQGQFYYFWLVKGGTHGYIGYSFLDGTIKQQIKPPVYPYEGGMQGSTFEHVCYHSDVFLFKDWLQESLTQFEKTGQVIPFKNSEPSEIYAFSEDFKLGGQSFRLMDENGQVIYEIEGIAPLVNLYIYNDRHEEVFKISKEIGHALATYRFYSNGELYGVLEKQFSLLRHKFAMELSIGRLELIEYTGDIGENYKVTLNGRLIGSIMENMDLNIPNLIFDNSFIIVYERDYLPLLTAMAVMVARELARDEDN